MKKLKYLVAALYILVIVCMGAATVIEKYHGTAYASDHIYGAWWFSALWALLAATGVACLLHQRVRRLSALLLHLSFVVILAGALLTHLTAKKGIVHLRKGISVEKYLPTDGKEQREKALPFALCLDEFHISYHEGTRAAADYVSIFTIAHGNDTRKARVSMNNIYSHGGVRLYQSSYDDDLQGSYLTMNSDPWGIPVTYTGYAMLFVALLWMLADPRGAYRQLLRNPVLRKGTLALALVLTAHHAEAQTPPTLSEPAAKAFGQLYIDYNDRICPLQTFALDFTKKLCGKRSYKGLSAEQVLAGFLFWGEEWSREPIIIIKSGELRQAKKLKPFCALNDFFTPDGGYVLGPMLHEYYQGQADKLHQEVLKTDDRLSLIMQVRQGQLLRMFPVPNAHSTTWHAPADRFPETVEPSRQTYIRSILAIMAEDAKAGRQSRVDEGLQKLHKYQLTYGAASIPSATRTRAELAYNAFPFATVLFMVNLTMGFLLLFYFIWKLSAATSRRRHGLLWGAFAVLTASFLALTACLALRWTVSGTIPMSNGYETMLLMAWMIMLVALLVFRRFHIILCFGFLMSGFFLLVSHISQMDPQITHVMPVLSSPLLTVHVSIIMMAFALLALTFVCGLTGLAVGLLNRQKKDHHAARDLALLSRLFLYPALTCLGFGIFTGAIWANISWGTYWSWDPKETWALITFMVYAVAVHDRSLPFLRRPMGYHLYMTLAFLTILMTYFGVNYFLGGMHSYA